MFFDVLHKLQGKLMVDQAMLIGYRQEFEGEYGRMRTDFGLSFPATANTASVCFRTDFDYFQDSTVYPLLLSNLMKWFRILSI